jgi:hypothetical protein
MSGAHGQGDHGRQIRFLDGREPAAVAAVPALGLVCSLSAPEQTGRASLAVPLLGRGADLLEVGAIFLALFQPASERRPALDQGLVDDLDRGARGRVAALHDQEARVHEVVDQAFDFVWRLRAFAQLLDRGNGTRALGRDELDHDGARQRLGRRR